LSGKASSSEEKQKVLELVKSVKGISSIDDKISIEAKMDKQDSGS
jgi:osmotically-inducible protein OsmY